MADRPEPGSARPMPASVIAAVSVNILFLGLLALEVSDSFVLRGGAVARSAYFLPPAALLCWGLLTRRRWAWRAARGAALAFALVNGGVAAFAGVARPHDAHGPVWVWLAAVGVVLAGLLVAGFLALGQTPARRFYGLDAPPSAG